MTSEWPDRESLENPLRDERDDGGLAPRPSEAAPPLEQPSFAPDESRNPLDALAGQPAGGPPPADAARPLTVQITQGMPTYAEPDPQVAGVAGRAARGEPDPPSTPDGGASLITEGSKAADGGADAGATPDDIGRGGD